MSLKSKLVFVLLFGILFQLIYIPVAVSEIPTRFTKLEIVNHKSKKYRYITIRAQYLKDSVTLIAETAPVAGYDKHLRSYYYEAELDENTKGGLAFTFETMNFDELKNLSDEKGDSEWKISYLNSDNTTGSFSVFSVADRRKEKEVRSYYSFCLRVLNKVKINFETLKPFGNKRGIPKRYKKIPLGSRAIPKEFTVINPNSTLHQRIVIKVGSEDRIVGDKKTGRYGIEKNVSLSINTSHSKGTDPLKFPIYSKNVVLTSQQSKRFFRNFQHLDHTAIEREESREENKDRTDLEWNIKYISGKGASRDMKSRSAGPYSTGGLKEYFSVFEQAFLLVGFSPYNLKPKTFFEGSSSSTAIPIKLFLKNTERSDYPKIEVSFKKKGEGTLIEYTASPSFVKNGNKPVLRKSVELTKDQNEPLLSAFRKLNFDMLSAEKVPDITSEHWILDFEDKNEFKTVNIWAPEYKTKERELETLIKFSEYVFNLLGFSDSTKTP